MNKSDLIEALARDNDLPKTKTADIVDLSFAEISKALTNGERVEIRGFCSIFVKDYKGYTGRNPKTRESVPVLPKRLPFFKCGKELKERVDWKHWELG